MIRHYFKYFELKGQQQVLRPTFNDICDSVPVPLAVVCDAPARKFHKTHNMPVKIQLGHLLKRVWQAEGAMGVRVEMPEES